MADFMDVKRVNALPGTLAPSTMYIVASAEAGLAEVVFSDKTGAASRHVLNKTEVQTMIDGAFSSFSNMLVVADIAARDALTLNRNALVLVLDASADATVDTGAATYVYNLATTTFVKIAEYESMDVTLTWTSIQGRPTSAVADIDDAVAKRHTHANLAYLNKVGEDLDGNFTYNGKYPKVYLAEAAW